MTADYPLLTTPARHWVTLTTPPFAAQKAKETVSSAIPDDASVAINRAEVTTASSRSRSQSSTTITSLPYPLSSSADSNNFWENLAHGAQAAVIIAVLVGVISIVGFSMWFCCGCCGAKSKRKRRSENRAIREGRSLPLHTVQNRGHAQPTLQNGEAPPPAYEEVVPPQHQRIAGGLSNTSEEDDAVVSDGKTPLSEIPFEDVVLDHSPSGSSASRTFEQSHHGYGGDTRGHTNS